MATKPADFKASGIRAERIIASGSASNPKLLIFSSGSAGNDGINVDTNTLRLSGTGSDSWLFISGSTGSTDRVVIGGHSVVSGAMFFAEQSSVPSAETGKGFLYVSTDKSLYFVDSDGASTAVSSGGGGGAFFTSVTNQEVFTTGSLVASGSITTKNPSGIVGVSLSSAGNISGSGGLQVGGNITVAGSINADINLPRNIFTDVSSITIGGAASTITIPGDVAVNGGDVTTTNTTAALFNTNATTVNIAGAATSGTNIGNVAGVTTIAGDIRIGGDDIKSSTGLNAITLSGANVEIVGDLQVTGNDIKSSTGATAITMTGASVEVAGDLKVTGNNIKSSSGTTVISFSGTEVIIPGDLTVNGATTTISTTNLEAKDTLIGLGFASGSIAQAAGDRGFVGGISGGNSVAFIWSNANSSFVATDTDSGVETSTVNIRNRKPIMASDFRIGGSSAALTSSDGQNVTLYSGGGSYIQLTPGGQGLRLGNESAPTSLTGSNIKISGSTNVSIYTSDDGISLYDDGVKYGSILGTYQGYGGNLVLISETGNTLKLSGSSVNIDSNDGLIYFGKADTERFIVDHTTATNVKLATRFPDGSAGTTRLTLSGGNGLSLGTNTDTINVEFTGSILGRLQNIGAGATFQVGSAPGKNLALSGSGNFNFIGGDAGFRFARHTNQHFFISANAANDSVIYSSNILEVSSSASRILVLSGGAGASQDPRSFADVNFYVSGSVASAGTATRGTALFAGDLAVSGNLKLGSGAVAGVVTINHAAPSSGVANIFNNAGTINLGTTSLVTMNLGTSGVSLQNYNFGTGTTLAGLARTFNIGTGGAAGSFNNVFFGSATAGALGTVWIRQPNVIMTGSLQVTGSVYAQKLTGSLTKLVDGTDYLRAGSNITLTTGSDGSVTIASTGGGTPFGSNKQIQFNDGGSFGGDAELTYDKTSNLLILTGSFVQGDGNTASGNYSHAEGEGTSATNVASHAEGKNSSATAIYSHAEGGFTLASGNYSHAEGYLSTASGQFSHAEGVRTVASGDYSHAEGEEATASGTYSHAGGQYTQAAGTGQTVFGKYNVQSNTTSLFVIGDGSSSVRHDILRVNSGSVEVTGSFVSTQGISGSLTKLSDGTSYLIAGANVTITSASNGAVTISAAGGGGGGGSSYFTDPVSGKLNTTGSLALAGNLGDTYTTANAGSDTHFFVSGSKGTIANRSTSGLSVFGGDIVTSGSITLDNGSGHGILHMTAGGELSLRNRYQGGYFVGSVFTSLGSAVNFMEVRPNGYATGSVASVFPGLYAGPANPFNSHDTTFFVSGKRGAKDGITRGASVFGGDVVASGSLYIGTNTTDSLVVNSLLASDIIPDGNRTRNLGSESARFANIYTGDLHLRNERGDWTIVEEPDYLSVINNRTGVKYKMMLERIQD